MAFACLLLRAKSEEKSLFKLIYTLGIGVLFGAWRIPLNGIPLKRGSGFWEGKKQQCFIIPARQKTWATAIVDGRNEGTCVFLEI